MTILIIQKNTFLWVNQQILFTSNLIIEVSVFLFIFVHSIIITFISVRRIIASYDTDSTLIMTSINAIHTLRILLMLSKNEHCFDIIYSIVTHPKVRLNSLCHFMILNAIEDQVRKYSTSD